MIRNRSYIRTISGNMEYELEHDINMKVSMITANNKVYINNIEAPTEEGEYKVKSVPNCILRVRRLKNNKYSNGYVNIQKSVGDNIINRDIVKNRKFKEIKEIKEIKGTKKNKDKQGKNKNDIAIIHDGDYIISGMGKMIADMNIIVKGDLIISGMNNKIYKGSKIDTLGTIKIKGDLIISGMNNIIGNVIKIDGDVINSGMNNNIQKG